MDYNKTNIETLSSFFDNWIKEFPVAGHLHFKNLIGKCGALFQPFVLSQPVIHSETKKAHYARARVLWFGEYLGGYWALSQEPIGSEKRNNAVVNYHTSKIAQPFTKQENIRFREYTNNVCPKIINTTRPFYNKTEPYSYFLQHARSIVIKEGVYKSKEISWFDRFKN